MMKLPVYEMQSYKPGTDQSPMQSWRLGTYIVVCCNWRSQPTYIGTPPVLGPKDFLYSMRALYRGAIKAK